MGSFYQMTFADKDGGPLDGGMIYRLRVPPNPPVNLYWSATVCDRATHAPVPRYEVVKPLSAGWLPYRGGLSQAGPQHSALSQKRLRAVS